MTLLFRETSTQFGSPLNYTELFTTETHLSHEDSDITLIGLDNNSVAQVLPKSHYTPGYNLSKEFVVRSECEFSSNDQNVNNQQFWIRVISNGKIVHLGNGNKFIQIKVCV